MGGENAREGGIDERDKGRKEGRERWEGEMGGRAEGPSEREKDMRVGMHTRVHVHNNVYLLRKWCIYTTNLCVRPVLYNTPLTGSIFS